MTGLIFVVITGFNDDGNMILVVELMVVFLVNFAMNNMKFRLDYTRARGPSVGPFAALFPSKLSIKDKLKLPDSLLI